MPQATPPSQRVAPFVPQIRLYQNWLQERLGLSFADYHALWNWSVTDLNTFWQSIWDYNDLRSPTPHRAALARNVMPGAEWFPGAQVNYARQALRHVDTAHAAGLPALISENEAGRRRELSWPELRQQVASLALHLKAQGVQPGDRVAAYLPNIPETMVALLACASVGAIWSVCPPDMGVGAVLDRFAQIEPKVLITINGMRWAGRDVDRTGVVRELRTGLPSVAHVVAVHYLPSVDAVADATPFAEATGRSDADAARFQPLWLPFDHPLWVVYSSGTTGLPKPIVHSHGGIVLVNAAAALNTDIGCSYASNSFGERFFWYSSTGWIMWNLQAAGPLSGTTCLLYDGSASGSKEAPDWTVLWRFAARHRVTFLGVGAAFYSGCMKAGLDLALCGDLSRVRALGTTGSPLPPAVQRWGSAQFRAIAATRAQRDIWWFNVSGGTDFAGGFIAGTPELPQKPGVMQARMMGASVQAWDDAGHPVRGRVGELVCTQPIPSMPLRFWNDPGNRRYLASYFETYAPGHGRKPGGGDLPPEAGSVWRHGDWLQIGDDNGEGEWCTIFGRSDTTINRHGLRMGTSEIYKAVESQPEVLEAMVVDLEYLGRDSYMPLFVVLRQGKELSDELKQRINAAIRSSLSPRFVPDAIFAVPEIPRTLSGKKQELPIKKLLLGQAVEKVIRQEAMANPSALQWFVDFAEQRRALTP